MRANSSPSITPNLGTAAPFQSAQHATDWGLTALVATVAPERDLLRGDPSKASVSAIAPLGQFVRLLASQRHGNYLPIHLSLWRSCAQEKSCRRSDRR